MKILVRFANMSLMATLMIILSASLYAQEDVRLASISLSAATVISGDSVDGRVTLNKPASADVEVTMAADPFNAAQVPVSVTVKAGEISATFKVSTVHGRILVGGADTEVGIFANYEVTQHVKLIIRPSISLDKIMDRVIEREHVFMDSLKQLHPLAETYIQNMREDPQHNVTPISDAYFFGRLDLVKTTEEATFQKDAKGKLSHMKVFTLLSAPFERHYVPEGFAQMAILDRDFKKENYTFDFVRQEFLGEIRCNVIDVMPKEHAPKGSFVGRIWVEDKQFNIVRFNGTYSNGSNYNAYLHFDSWRMNMQPGVWLPAYIYSEETDTTRKTPPFHIARFKAQTRLWNYDELHIEHPTEMANIKVEYVADSSEAQQDGAPLEAQRAWERLAEDNAIDHLQKIGLVAMPSPVDKILQTVVNNLIITNNLEIIPEVRCRVLLTTPLESFTVGHTIVLSRGLIDVLPDEASLAMVLSHELAHIALGHKIDTKFAFNDRMFFPDPVTFQRMSFERSPMDETAADTKAMDLLKNSPYKDNLVTAGLFLKELQARGPVLPNLIRAHMGNPLDSKTGVRLASVAGAAPQLENKVEQIAALSLGARVRLDPWSNRIEMQNIKHITMLSQADKMPLEVTPFLPYLTRLKDWSAQAPLPNATDETAASK
jgi:Peptidase family M48